MDSKALVKEFYEQVASNNRGDEVEHYVHPDCTLRAGEENIPIGLEGMREHLADVRQTYPDFRIRVWFRQCKFDHQGQPNFDHPGHSSAAAVLSCIWLLFLPSLSVSFSL